MTTLMRWNEEMSVGVKALDEDHKRLVGLLNELQVGILGGHRQEALGRVLDQLVSYTKIHFAREEELFASTAYESAAEHKEEHDTLVRQAQQLQERAQSGATSMLSLETMSFLKHWLTRHILVADRRYGLHLNAKGVH